MGEKLAAVFLLGIGVYNACMAIVVLDEIRRALHAGASKEDAAFLPSFFKTGKGEYGEGDVFIGVRVPHARRVVKTYADKATASDIEALLGSKIHEERLCGLFLMVQQFEKGRDALRERIVRQYLRLKDRVNNWDLVDASAPQILGVWLQERPRDELYRLAKSTTLWHRRIAVVACHAFIKRGEFADILALAALLLDDTHDLMHKAIGWMLREVGKKDEKTLRTFLRTHYDRLPRTTLRYAIERYRPQTRSEILKGVF